MRELMRIVRNQNQIEHEGFYHGSQGCEPSKALAEIHSHIEQKMEETSQKSIPRIKKLEAEIEDSRRNCQQPRIAWKVSRRASVGVFLRLQSPPSL